MVNLKEAFFTELKDFKERRAAVVAAKNEVQAENLTKKKGLIAKLREIIQNEENIGAAFGGLKEIQDTWKEIGDIPSKIKKHENSL